MLEDLPLWAVGIIRSLLQTLYLRDPYTFGHCCRVSYYSQHLAQAAGLSEHEQKVIEYASLFHDIGKVGIPDRVLRKPQRLNSEEMTLMKTHPELGETILQPLAAQLPFFKALLPGIRSHHERIDGTGYPDGSTEDHIPLLAKIILIADTFDAMTTDRPYRQGLDLSSAYKELKQFSGRQFDASLVKIFLQAHGHWKPTPTQQFLALLNLPAGSANSLLSLTPDSLQPLTPLKPFKRAAS